MKANILATGLVTSNDLIQTGISLYCILLLETETGHHSGCFVAVTA
jgi:hypothetical protein